MKWAVSCISAFVVFVCVSWVYSHCHNDGEGPEDPSIVKGDKKWPTSRKIPGTNIYEIYWYLNPTYPNKPSLSPDAGDAADAWSEIRFRNKIINFQYYLDDTTSRSPEQNRDNVNVVGYGRLSGGREDPAAAVAAIRYIVSTKLITEVDIIVNYYKDFTPHSVSEATKHCLLDVLTHEFGHMAGLKDVYYDPDEDPSPTNSPDYDHYTMNGEGVVNEHFRESLNCEDKYALEDKYGSRNP